MKKYIVDVLMPFGWWTVCATDSEQEAREFERKQKLGGAATRLHTGVPSTKLTISVNPVKS